MWLALVPEPGSAARALRTPSSDVPWLSPGDSRLFAIRSVSEPRFWGGDLAASSSMSWAHEGQDTELQECKGVISWKHGGSTWRSRHVQRSSGKAREI